MIQKESPHFCFFPTDQEVQQMNQDPEKRKDQSEIPEEEEESNQGDQIFCTNSTRK